MLFCCWLGVEWVNNCNSIFMGSILIGTLSFIIGTMYRPADHIGGYTSYSLDTFLSNQAPRFTAETQFFTLFGVFFPAVTGVLQGANLTGELKDPGSSIPMGTSAAIAFCSVVYLVILFICAATGTPALLSDFANTDFQGSISVWRPLVIQGIYSAALSTSVGMLMGAPRILIATLEDGMFPKWMDWIKVLSASGDPMRGYIVATVIACVVTVFGGSLNKISPLVSNLYMIVYGIINLACFLADHYSSPGWRPQFRYFNKWVALLGCAMCIGSMFVIDLSSALVVIFLSLALYWWIGRQKPVISGGAMEAAAFLSAVTSVVHLETMTEGSKKNFRPTLMVLSNLCADPQRVLQVSSLFYKSHSLMTQARVIVGEVTKSALRERRQAASSVRVSSKITALNQVVINASLLGGVSALVQAGGLGRLSPNTIVIEFDENWRAASDAKLAEFVEVVKFCLRFEMALVIVRAPRFKHDESTRQLGYIDAHWMYDDGGMTILLGHLLKQSKAWEQCRMRVFVPNEEEERDMMFNRAANMLTFNAHTVNSEELRNELNRHIKAWKGEDAGGSAGGSSVGAAPAPLSERVDPSAAPGGSAATPATSAAAAARPSIFDLGLGIEKPATSSPPLSSTSRATKSASDRVSIFDLGFGIQPPSATATTPTASSDASSAAIELATAAAAPTSTSALASKVTAASVVSMPAIPPFGGTRAKSSDSSTVDLRALPKEAVSSPAPAAATASSKVVAAIPAAAITHAGESAASSQQPTSESVSNDRNEEFAKLMKLLRIKAKTYTISKDSLSRVDGASHVRVSRRTACGLNQKRSLFRIANPCFH